MSKVLHTYTKKMSRSDAMEQTRGRKVPYLRFSGHGSEDNADLYYETIFKSCKWYHGFFGKSIVEMLDITVYYYFNGRLIGNDETLITYNSERSGQANRPTTWLHWPENMIKFFEDRTLGGSEVVIKQFDNGVYALGITSNA